MGNRSKIISWVPFLPPHKAFILYACWDLANLHGNSVTLVALDETRAEIRAQLHYFALYRRAVHIAPQICEADYREIFETTWQDRAISAGWKVQFHYEEEETIFQFVRA
jgi:hypothetical protein